MTLGLTITNDLNPNSHINKVTIQLINECKKHKSISHQTILLIVNSII